MIGRGFAINAILLFVQEKANPFIDAIRAGKIADEAQLKRLFRKLAKTRHPDTATPGSNDAFVRLKSDFETAKEFLTLAATERNRDAGQRPPDFARCSALFSELMASNFPIDRRARRGIYLDRVSELDRQIGLLSPADAGLFLAAEEELYRIKGNTVVSNHIFNLVKLYLHNMSDWLLMKNYFAKLYLKKSYRIVVDALAEKKAAATIRLIDWFLSDILET
jgi:hypothetical protein